MRLPRQPEARPALVGARAASSSRCSTGPTCGWKPAAWSSARVFAAQRGSRRALAAERRDEIARCRGEVILSAGAIGSTQLLLLSGVGPAPSSQALGIPVVLDKPGVGANLQDHLQLRLIYKVSGAKTLNETYHSPFGRAGMGLEYALFRTGPLTMAPSQLGIFTRSDPSRERANIQFHVQPLSLDKFGDPLHAFPAFTASVCNLQPTSRGQVRLRSRRSRRQADDQAELPLRPTKTAGLRPIRSASRATSWRSRRWRTFSPVEYLPGAAVGNDDAALIKAAGDIGTTIFHPVGTAKMGRASDPAAVVDERLRVIGHRGLAGGRRLGDADHHLGQHQCADHDDRRERRRDDPRRPALIAPRRCATVASVDGGGRRQRVHGSWGRWKT